MDTYGKARELRPGMRFRWFGRGYMARTVATVAGMCNCQCPRGFTCGGTPDQAIGHQPPAGREHARHFAVLVVTPDGRGPWGPETFVMLPHQDVCITDEEF